MFRECGEKVVVINCCVCYDYNIEKLYEVGMVFIGIEVKLFCQGCVNFSDGYVFVKGNEVFFDLVYILEYFQGYWINYFVKCICKLLLYWEEIVKIVYVVLVGGYIFILLKFYFLDG